MMDLKLSAQKILKKVYAGKEEDPKDTSEERGVQTIPQPEERDGKKTSSYLYFTADRANKINFADLYNEVKEKGDVLFDKLKEGNFFWEKIIVKTNEYGANPVPEEKSYIFSVDLNRDGTPRETTIGLINISNNKKLSPSVEENYQAYIEKIKSMVFSDGILNFEYNPVYIPGNFTNDHIVRIAKNIPIDGAIKADNTFTEAYPISGFRLRTMSGTNIPSAVNSDEILVGPKYDVPNPQVDNFMGKNVAFLGTLGPGGQMDDLKKAIAEGAQEAPKKEQQKTQEDTPVNEPVDEQKPTTKEEVTNKFAKDEKESKIVELKKDDPDANYYTGDNSVMQDLVRRQHKKMKIRKHAGLEPGKIPDPNTADGIKKTKDYLDKKQDVVKDLENAKKEINNLSQKSTSPFSNKGAMNAPSNLVDSVLSRYLNK